MEVLTEMQIFAKAIFMVPFCGYIKAFGKNSAATQV